MKVLMVEYKQKFWIFSREDTFFNQSHSSVKYAQEKDNSVRDQTLLSTSSFVATGYLTLIE